MEHRMINHHSYTCFRPDRPVRRLDFDVFSPGLEKGLRIFLDDESVNLLLFDGKLWFSAYLRPEKLLGKAFRDPHWFFYHLGVRESILASIRQSLLELHPRVQSLDATSPAEKKHILTTLIDDMREFVAYGMLANSDEFAVQRLRELINGLLEESEVNSYLFEILTPSSYVHNMLLTKLSEQKTLQLPPIDPLVLPTGNVSMVPAVSVRDGTLFEGLLRRHTPAAADLAIQFALLRTFAPILYQLNEENHYIGKSILGHIEHVLYHVACDMVRQHQIEHVSELLDFSLSRVMDLVEVT